MPFIDELFEYLNDVFVETGTYQGDTLYRVANNNIKKSNVIISLELSEIFYNNCKKRFHESLNISIYNANSKYDLYNIINNIEGKITFWLDSHWSGVPDIGCDQETICPILYELEQIKKHNNNTHTIIIDDIRLMDNLHFPVTLEEIIKKLFEINNKYKLKFYDDYTSKNDILVAYIDENTLFDESYYNNNKICIHKYMNICKTNPQPPGLGDFIRGTIALYNFSKLYNYTLYIDDQHIIFNYLKKSKNVISNSIVTDIVELLPPLSYEEIYLKLQHKFELDKSFSIITNSFYTKKNNILMNYGEITDDCKKYLKDIFSPSLEIENKIQYIFDNVYNIDLNSQFKVIHLRFGDKIMHNTLFNHELYSIFYDKIICLLNNSDKNIKYVLISDSSEISQKLKTNISDLFYWNNSKIHLGDLKNNISGVIDTLVDFFIMSKSNEIISNSSGFSMCVSEIYNIKYSVF